MNRPRMKMILYVMGLLVLSWIGLTEADDKFGTWKRIGESHGIVGYNRDVAGMSVREVKAVGMVDAPVAVIEAVIRDARAAREYMFMCSESYQCELEGRPTTKDSYYIYNRIGLPWPVADRDAVARMDFQVDPKSGALSVRTEGIQSSYRANEKGTIRVPRVVLQCIIVPKGQEKTEVTYLALADMGGSIPMPLANLLSRDLGIKTIEGVRRLARRDEYRKASALVTTTVWVR